MSTTVLCCGRRFVFSSTTGCQTLAALRVTKTRNFSAASSDEPYIAASPADSGQRTVWPDESMGPFGPQDQRFQLPGNVGFDCHLEGLSQNKKNLQNVHKTVPDVLTAPSSSERHHFVLAQFVNEFHGKLGPIATRVQKADHYFTQTETDCMINSCPELLRKDLELMFPSVPPSAITVVTVTQKSGRRDDARRDNARRDDDLLFDRFVNGAKEMCFALWTAGYWADFIDPSTGTAFFASASSQNSLSTEELRNLGFHIEVSSSCTVIRHILRGTPMFVGTVFTNAPTHSAAVARLQGVTNVLDEDE
ncbi:metabolism of cobalamin associated Da [Eucyclogobius newberryi]|uniref:metabolism of cobalamin associated Da n=1 Tax=Eucyclogobius newberryi TaxID=166745 RepID=UPI003B59EF8B